MFGLYFGKYLVDNGVISQSEYENVIAQLQQASVKLGLIAVSEKLLTTKQADEINDIQKKKDQRFGDIAIDKGYLLHEEVAYLLNMQGNSYMKFIQVLTDQNILSLSQIENHMENFKNKNHFSTSDLDALKSGDIDRIIPVFAGMDTNIGSEYIGLAIRNIIRFINNKAILQKAYRTSEYYVEKLAFQKVVGDHNIFLGFSGRENALLKIANPFAKESFTELDEDAFDSVCEFINCTNGLYATKLSCEGILIDMTPPLFYTEKKLSCKKEMYIIPIIIEGEQTDLIAAVDCQVEII